MRKQNPQWYFALGKKQQLFQPTALNGTQCLMLLGILSSTCGEVLKVWTRKIMFM